MAKVKRVQSFLPFQLNIACYKTVEINLPLARSNLLIETKGQIEESYCIRYVLLHPFDTKIPAKTLIFQKSPCTENSRVTQRNGSKH